MAGSKPLWILVIVCTVIYNCDGLRCLQCQDLPHPRDCVHAASCATDETCFTEEVVTLSGDIVFQTGCMPQLQCSSAGRRSSENRRNGDITTCIECCHGEFCNLHGCGTSEVPRDQRGPYCFSCPVTWEHQRCNKVVTCGQNEICGLHTPRDFFNVPEVVYESSCMSTTQCTTLLSSHSNTKCIPTCCDKDFCNVQCNASSADLLTSTVPVPTNPTTAYVPSCPSDHLHDPGSGLCIKILSGLQGITWTAAQSGCSAIGDHLVTIDSQQKMAYIQHSLAGTNNSLFWIGGRDQYDNDTFSWSNGHKFSYTNWGAEQPNKGNQDCVGIYVPDNLRWHDDPCNRQWDGYICEHSTVTPVVKPFQCPTSGGYMDLGHGLCIHVHRNGQVTWQQARDRCHHENADLVVIDTKAKTTALRTYLDTNDQTRHFWVGGYDMQKTNTFMWVTGHPFSYTDWYSDHIGDHNQPDNTNSHGQDEDCVAVYPYRSVHHHWVDDMCSHLHNYVCQLS